MSLWSCTCDLENKYTVMSGFLWNPNITKLETKEQKQVRLVVIGLPGATGMLVQEQETKAEVRRPELSWTPTESNE